MTRPTDILDEAVRVGTSSGGGRDGSDPHAHADERTEIAPYRPPAAGAARAGPRTAVTARPEECAQPASVHVLLSGAYEAPPSGAGEVPSGKGRLRRRASGRRRRPRRVPR